MDDKTKKWSMLCYLPVVNVLTCLLASVQCVDNTECRFHARQGLVIFGLFFFNIIFSFMFYTLGLLIHGIILLMYVSALVSVSMGNKIEFPGIKQIALKIPEFYLYSLLTGKQPSNSWVNPTDDQNTNI